eukprot:1161162-Pelagomonas_calceolata.AAC.2
MCKCKCIEEATVGAAFAPALMTGRLMMAQPVVGASSRSFVTCAGKQRDRCVISEASQRLRLPNCFHEVSIVYNKGLTIVQVDPTKRMEDEMI